MLIIYSMKRSETIFGFFSCIKYTMDFIRYSWSANIYATSDTSFEDVTLKFLALKDKEPLRAYLQSVLQIQQPSTVNG